jgi:hypothetical protein
VADFLSVSSAGFKKTRSRESIVPMHLSAVHRKGRNVTSKNNIAIRFILTSSCSIIIYTGCIFGTWIHRRVIFSLYNKENIS